MSVEILILVSAVAGFLIGCFAASLSAMGDSFDVEFNDYRHPPVAIVLQIMSARLRKYKIALAVEIVIIAALLIACGWLLWR